jgi:hypothetical protein
LSSGALQVEVNLQVHLKLLRSSGDLDFLLSKEKSHRQTYKVQFNRKLVVPDLVDQFNWLNINQFNLRNPEILKLAKSDDQQTTDQ